MLNRAFWSLLALVVVLPARLCGMDAPNQTPEDQFREAVAVCRGTVLGETSFRDTEGRLRTRTRIQVLETFKGLFPEVVQLVHPGGFDGRRGVQWGHNPDFKAGDERLLYLGRRPDGTLFCLNGGGSAPRLRPRGVGPGQLQPAMHPSLLRLRAQVGRQPAPGEDVTDQAAGAPGLADLAGPSVPPPPALTGLLTDPQGISARFVTSDRGEAIPYLVDATTLPPGITLAQALAAARQAFDAWEAVTGCRFRFDGTQRFGRSPSEIEADDGRIRLQLHDTYRVIPAPSVLGIGGRAYFTSDPGEAAWGLGGAVAGAEFHLAVNGFVVLSHTSTAMRNLSTFTEVLCHEIGHVLSLAHSSENPSEGNSRLKEAMMYYSAHGDGRGARLTAYDQETVVQVFPKHNTPPASYDRLIDAVTQQGGAGNTAAANDIVAAGYDLQSASLSLEVGSSTSDNGEFSVAGMVVRYRPAGFFEAERVPDLAGGQYYDRIRIRHSDGTNASAYATIRVVSFSTDQNRDGLPEAWIRGYFPGGGANALASADPDRDGLTNLQEYFLGSDPSRADSRLKVLGINQSSLEFQAKPYDLYEIHGSTDGVTFRRMYPPVVPTSTPGILTDYQLPGVPSLMLRVVKVP